MDVGGGGGGGGGGLAKNCQTSSMKSLNEIFLLTFSLFRCLNRVSKFIR